LRGLEVQYQGFQGWPVVLGREVGGRGDHLPFADRAPGLFRATQDQFYSGAYLSTADWNDTRFKNETFDKLLISARGELDEAKRREMYREMAMLVRDEGGTILPMFNDFVNAGTKKLMGYVSDIGNDMSNGYVASRVWLSA